MRGTQRSRPVDAVREEAERLAARGVRELHLVAQDLTHYGFDLPGRPDLLDLATALSGVGGIEWIRLLYAHPAHLTPRLLEGLFSVPKVVPYLDLPVQHASDRLLRRMNRPYTAARVREQVGWLRAHVPGITLRSTVIVGFPGETEADFAALARFVAEVRFDHLGVFTYSREPGTQSFDLSGRPRRSTAERRLHALVEIQMQVAARRSAGLLGAEQRVLVDARLQGPDPEGAPLAAGAVALGRGEGEALDIDGAVFLEAGEVDPEAIAPGRFVAARVTAVDVYDRRARVLRVESGTRCGSAD
jgi:ribosomal protein S12 methylthiotransferase